MPKANYAAKGRYKGNCKKKGLSFLGDSPS